MRSSKLPKDQLVLSCEANDCDKRFANVTGVRTHMAKAHGYRKNLAPKIENNERKCGSCNKEFPSVASLRAHGSFEVCAKRLAKNWKLVECPTCGKVNNKYVGRKSGKGSIFCDVKCSNSAINRSPIQKTLKEKLCLNCSKSFNPSRGKQKFHSLACAQSYKGYKISDSTRMGGAREGGGRSKVFEYTSRFGEMMKLNREEILCAEFLDASDFKWIRGKVGFPYLNEAGLERKFYPDFFVEELNLYVEYKGWLTDSMRHKMNDARARNPHLNLLILVGDDPRYLNDGVQLSGIETDYLAGYGQ